MLRLLCPFCNTFCDPVKPCPAQVDTPTPEVQTPPRTERPGFFRGARVKLKQQTGD